MNALTFAAFIARDRRSDERARVERDERDERS
jgi:hypothetical protein